MAATDIHAEARGAQVLIRVHPRKNNQTPLRRLTDFIGLDRAVAYVIFGRMWNTAAGVITLYAILRCLHPDEQGFYYTFNSVLGIQIFFELGFSYTLMQCVSHEKAHLNWTEEGTLAGSIREKHRVAALLRIAIKWYGVAAVLFFAGVLPVGLVFFQKAGSTHPSVVWRVPWLWLAMAESLILFVSPFFVFLEGAGLVARVALIRLTTGVLTSLALWSALWRGWALLAAPLVSTVACLSSGLWLGLWHRSYFLDLLRTRPAPGVLNWRTEIWPFQWRISLSWLSGYFISQLAIPVLFRYQGAIAAGQMGLSISLVLAAQAVGMAWVNTKAPQFGMYVARGEYRALDHLFFRTLKQALGVLFAVSVFLELSVVAVTVFGSSYAQRILAPSLFLQVIGRMMLDCTVYFLAVYLRAHKQEPLMGLSLASAVLIGVSTYVFGRYWGIAGIVAGNLGVTMFSLPVAATIFQRKRRLWHTTSARSARSFVRGQEFGIKQF